MLLKLITFVFEYGSLIFAVGFLWPLFAQTLSYVGWVPPFGLSPLVAIFVPAIALGLMAQVRGTWLWQR